MGNNSTKMNSLKVMQGRKAEVVKTTKTLTHSDIKRFFLKFAEAIFADQQRVNIFIRFTITEGGGELAKSILMPLWTYP
jgi:hypothetical protein